MQRPGIQFLILTAFFTGAYFTLRALPNSNCNFLHYEQTYVTADGLEFCGGTVSHFIDLSQLPFPVKVNLTADGAPEVGKEVHYSLTLETDGGKILRPSELAVTQTQKLHLLFLDPSLGDYQHIHPAPVGDSGEWTFSFTPRQPGDYKVFAQFIPSLTMREMVGEAKISVPGMPAAGVNRGLAPYSDGEYTYTLKDSLGGPAIPVKTDSTLMLTVQRKDGGMVTMEPVMGTDGHMVAFDLARNGFAHLHPIQNSQDPDPLKPAIKHDITFSLNLAQPGRYRVWGQVKLDGRERFAPFDVVVE